MCPAAARPARSERAGVARHHHGVERTDIDSQLERIGGYHGADLSIAKPALDFAPLPGQISAAVSTHGLAGEAAAIEGVFEVRDEDLCRQPVVREHQRLQIPLDELERNPARLVDVAPADAQLPIHYRRIVQDEEALTARRAVAVHQVEGIAGQGFGQLPRVGNGCGAADEPRPRSVEFADSLEAVDQVGQVAAVNSPIVMQFVDNDIAQVLEVFGPARVMRQDPAVQHVRVGQDNVGALPDGLARFLGSIAVICEGANAAAGFVHSGLEFVQLVLGQRLGGKQIHRPRLCIRQQEVEDGQVITKRFAAGGGGDDDDVAAGLNGFQRLRLVRVEAADAAPRQGLAQLDIHGVRHILVLAFGGGLVADRANG